MWRQRRADGLLRLRDKRRVQTDHNYTNTYYGSCPKHYAEVLGVNPQKRDVYNVPGLYVLLNNNSSVFNERKENMCHHTKAGTSTTPHCRANQQRFWLNPKEAVQDEKTVRESLDLHGMKRHRLSKRFRTPCWMKLPLQ
ncbi:hypothetical protein WAI453_011784 [Rhynchosporium graminicola]